MPDPREQFLRDIGYTEKAIAFIIGEINVGELDDPSVAVRHQGHCGDIMILHLRIDPGSGIIRDARFRLTGCAGLQAAGSAVTDMVRGMRIDSVREIGVDEIVAHLGGSFPEVKLDCVEVARDTLHQAAAEYAATSGAEQSPIRAVKRTDPLRP
jgi:NifU-like protein involved in Fe-S cluster formation